MTQALPKLITVSKLRESDRLVSSIFPDFELDGARDFSIVRVLIFFATRGETFSLLARSQEHYERSLSLASVHPIVNSSEEDKREQQPSSHMDDLAVVRQLLISASACALSAKRKIDHLTQKVDRVAFIYNSNNTEE
ncbi:MAG: hypothetical protein KME22_30750 [Hassallia sp. WJT32-NPBG1]|jgi:hypothetical protein|nr:hypothetical protein [Hassallia sp. WJT32-NPBG1]